VTEESLAAIRSRILGLVELRRHDEVIALARRGLALAPDDSWLLAQLGNALADRDPKAAREAVGRAVAAAPDDPWAHRMAGRVLLTTGRAKAARQHAERAVALDPTDASSHLLLANVYGDCGLPTKAAQACDEVVRLAPHSPAGYVQRSKQMIEAKNWAAAERWARHALEIDPANSAALNNLAVVLRQQGRWTEALDLFSRAAAAEPGDSVSADNARDTARNLGGVAMGGLAIYGLITVVRIGFAASSTAGVVVLVTLLVVLVVVGRRRSAREIEALPSHLQAFVRDQQRARWRDPQAWTGRTWPQRIFRAVVVAVLVIVVVAPDPDDEPSRSDPLTPPTVSAEQLACLQERLDDPSVVCDAG
jgi:tetratricopeptide (TPR) repeat protein